MSTVTTAHGDGADRTEHGALRTVSPSRILPWPNGLGKAREEASRGAKIFCGPSPLPERFSWLSALPRASISASEVTR